MSPVRAFASRHGFQHGCGVRSFHVTIRSCLLASALLSAPVLAQDDEVTEPIAQTIAPEPSPLSAAQAAAARGDHAEALSRFLRLLSTEPDNVAALSGAGTAALGVGDVNAATGFYARAEALDPRNGPVKAGLAVTLMQNGNPRGALRLFKEATDLGVPVASIAANRGLAYDLRGDPRRAQADYQLVLATHPDAEVTRRLATSQAISGDLTSAMATLDPLLRRQDVAAWRTRAFVFALTGDVAGATAGAALVMPRDQVAALTPYLARLGSLRAADKAAAIHLGRFPGEGPQDVRQAARTVSAPKLPIDEAVLKAPPVVVAAPAPQPAPVEPAGPTPQELAARRKAEAAAQARADAAAKAKAAALAKAKEEREEKAAAQALARKNPARHFVQVAGGANESDLVKEWDKLKDKWSTQLRGQSPWKMHYRFTNRLMIGPFPTSGAAQSWVSARNKEGFSTFRVSTRAGEVVERLN
jgi:Flp pilus assembly protein TadD